MAYSIIFMITLLITTCAEFFFIGRYILSKYKMFQQNVFTAVSLSVVVYFFITFASLFIFIWVNVPLIYIVIVFGIKEALQFMFFFINRDIIFKRSDIKKTLMALIGVATVGLMSHYVFDPVLGTKPSVYTDKFELIGLLKDALTNVLAVKVEYVYDILFNGLVSFMGYVVTLSIITTFSKRQKLLDFVFAAIGTLIIAICFNFGSTLSTMSGVYMILLSFLFAYHVIMYYRRRYGVFIGMNSFVVWALEPKLFIAMVVVSVATLIIYGWLNKPKISLFAVQLISPLIVIGTFLLYESSPILASFLIAFTVIGYGLIVGVGSSKLLDSINNIFVKMKYAFPTLIAVTTLVAGITLGVTQHVNWKDMILYKSAIFDSYGNKDYDLAQQIALYALEGILIFTLIRFAVVKIKAINMRILVILTSMIFIIGYNPFINITLHQLTGGEQFEYIRIVIFAPLILAMVVQMRKVIYKRIEFHLHSGKRRNRNRQYHYPRQNP